MSRERKQRNKNLVRFYNTGKYTLRSLGKVFRIKHQTAYKIIKRYKYGKR